PQPALLGLQDTNVSPTRIWCLEGEGPGSGRSRGFYGEQHMTTETDALILRYLQQLESQLGDLPDNRRQELLDEVPEHITAARAALQPATPRRLPANRRQELLDEVQEHITAARAALEPETEAGVRTLLERLGDPADIA